MAVIVLDDRDPAISYSATGWSPLGNPDAEYKGTTTLGLPSSNTSATLTFNGTGVMVLGTIGWGTVQISSYSIDGGPVMTFTSMNTSVTRYLQTFFTSGEIFLYPGTHTLVMTPVQAAMYIDLITVNVLAGWVGSTGTAVATTATVTASTTLEAPQFTATSTMGESTSSRFSPIVGGVLGGVSFVCISLLVVFYLRRSKTTIRKGHRLIHFDHGQLGDYDSGSQMGTLVSPYDLSISGPRSLYAAAKISKYTVMSNGSTLMEGTDENNGISARHRIEGGMLRQHERTLSPPPVYRFMGKIGV